MCNKISKLRHIHNRTPQCKQIHTHTKSPLRSKHLKLSKNAFQNSHLHLFQDKNQLRRYDFSKKFIMSKFRKSNVTELVSKSAIQ